MNSLRIWTILSELNHNLSAINNLSIKLLHSLLSLVRVLVPNKRETTRFTSPSVSGNEDVDDFAVPVEEREEIVCVCTESDVEDEKRVSVSDVWRTGSSEMRHLLLFPPPLTRLGFSSFLRWRFLR